MPSFDIVSEVEMQELTNAVDQANRELETRYDFRGVDASFDRSENKVTMIAEADFQLQQLLEILKSKLIKRSIDVKCLDIADHYASGKQVKQEVTVREGLDKELTKKLVKLIKESKVKVQAAIQGDKVRVTGKKRDDLQECIALLRETELDMPLQFNNFRD
ncbi:YajQ family cyclic di-GMP-binding protein [Aestuariirhabdus litorea]|uniref:Nucleotide-binding protein D0544_15920 n=1 Tax=Aestuariirhabdus litorea TaxID=2528527 RepID=A0A3P3VN14_9GAMM|nr:YajQ family cyclic di-GMP-binding protein [Aestuariirhabdus litorea]RRJ83308.1 YajQ family cyclic di-GMP-binding protein [Aestuariirhabdus litorea]RWW93468.1 YajQ family cyclic di-GMP-binding protein [Endozoicomonadaceae bacterium GTF-13]